MTEFVISGKWGVAKKKVGAQRIPGYAGKRPRIRPGKGTKNRCKPEIQL
jgi:hypothetical protein